MWKHQCPHTNTHTQMRRRSLSNSSGIRQHFHPRRGAFFNGISETLSYWDAQSRPRKRWKRRKKKQEKRDMSELTVSSRFSAWSVNSLLSVFSRIWLYSMSASFMCPLKTRFDGLSCFLKVAFEAASLTGWGELDQSQVFDQESYCKMANFDEKRWFFLSLKALFKSYTLQRQSRTRSN